MTLFFRRRQKLFAALLAFIVVSNVLFGALGPVGVLPPPKAEAFEPLTLLIVGLSVAGLSGIAAGSFYLFPQWSKKVTEATFGGILETLGGLAYHLTKAFFYFSGTLFDNLIEYSFKNNLFATKNDGGQPVETPITSSWKIVRDIANLLLIFFVLYVAIGTMLELQGIGPKILVNIVIAALLINFSFPLTRAALDASNVASLVFWERLTAADSSGEKSASGKIGTILRFDNLYDTVKQLNELPPEKFALLNTSTSGATGGEESETAQMLRQGNVTLAIVNFGIAITLAIAGFVLLSGAFIFLVRLVKFIMLIILSPLAFLAAAWPGGTLKKYWTEWLDGLTAQTIVAPVYLFFLYLAIQVGSATELFFASNDTNYAMAFLGLTTGSGDGGTIALIVNFFIMISLLLMATTAANEVASATAGTAKTLASWTTGLGAGVLAAGGRQGLGRLSQKGHEWVSAKRPEDYGNWAGRFFGTRLKDFGKKITDLGRQGSYDIRDLPVDLGLPSILSAGYIKTGAPTLGKLTPLGESSAKGRGGYAYGEREAEREKEKKEREDKERASEKKVSDANSRLPFLTNTAEIQVEMEKLSSEERLKLKDNILEKSDVALVLSDDELKDLRKKKPKLFDKVISARLDNPKIDKKAIKETIKLMGIANWRVLNKSVLTKNGNIAAAFSDDDFGVLTMADNLKAPADQLNSSEKQRIARWATEDIRNKKAAGKKLSPKEEDLVNYLTIGPNSTIWNRSNVLGL